MSTEHRVVIVGGGFGGLNVVRHLRRASVQITLVDRRNFHLFQPLLYQVATGGLSPANIASPLRAILRRQKNACVLLGEVADVRPQQHCVVTTHGEIPYDTLVIAAGARYSHFGHDDWEKFAPGLKSIEDATNIRGRILHAFENAERTNDPAERRAYLTFVITGGGPTGVELAGSLSELARHTLKYDYRNINPADATIVLVEPQEDVLAGFPEKLRHKATQTLERLGVDVRTRTMVTDVRDGSVVLKSDDGEQAVDAHTVLWAAGVRAVPLNDALAQATGAAQDHAGRLVVEPNLSLPGHPEIFVIGDAASFTHQDDHSLPGVAPVAIQQGQYVARLIRQRLRGGELAPFHYRDRGSLATIGRSAAVAKVGRWELSGRTAWLLWALVHVAELLQVENRLLVLLQWAWSYFTYNRAARLITGEPDAIQPTTRDSA